MKKISVLGSTGSVGTQTLEVVRSHADLYQVVALTCGHNVELMKQQIKEFHPLFAACSDEKDCLALEKEFPDVEFGFGMDGICHAAQLEEAEIVVNSLLGMMGLRPTFAAIEAKKDIAFANKETLVAGGKLMTDAVKTAGIQLLPVDSEHSAIFQSIQGSCSPISKILLTASGGPFRGYSKEQLQQVTKAQALKHPNWSMGAKITIDSATMMNKGLEIIEAAHLFDVHPDKIEVLVHPESILHSAVEFADGAVIGQMGVPDMKVPIAYALSWPKRLENVSASVDWFKIGTLHFEKPDPKVFRCLGLAFDAIKSGHSFQIAMNAANEEAVAAFLQDRIRFVQIADIIERVMNRSWFNVQCLDEIFAVEAESRSLAKDIIQKIG